MPQPGVALGHGVGVRFEHDRTFAATLDQLDHVLALRPYDLGLDVGAVRAGRLENAAGDRGRVVAPALLPGVAGGLHQLLEELDTGPAVRVDPGDDRIFDRGLGGDGHCIIARAATGSTASTLPLRTP